MSPRVHLKPEKRLPGIARQWSKAGFFGCLAILVGCGPRIEVVDPTGLSLMEVSRGLCFVGCNLSIKLGDGTECRGYTPGFDHGHPLVADIFCPDKPNSILHVDILQKNAPNPGTLTPDRCFICSAPTDIDAIIKKTRPS